jgi:hypothetical protein
MIPVVTHTLDCPPDEVLPATVPTTQRFVELWIRPLPDGTHEEHEVLVAVLARLEAVDAIDGFVVHRWGRDVCTDEFGAATRRDRRARRRLDDIREWAEETGAEVPDFECETTVGTGRMGPEHETVRLPATAIVVFEGGVITDVVPAVRDGDRRTLTEWLGAEETAAEIEAFPLIVP